MHRRDLTVWQAALTGVSSDRWRNIAVALIDCGYELTSHCQYLSSLIVSCRLPGFSVFVLWDFAVEQRNQGLASGCGLSAVSEHDVAGADRFPVEALVGVTVRSQRGAAQ